MTIAELTAKGYILEPDDLILPPNKRGRPLLFSSLFIAVAVQQQT